MAFQVWSDSGDLPKWWPGVEPDLLQFLAKEKVLDNVIVLKDIYPWLEIKKVVKESENEVEFVVEFDYKKYQFTYKKTQGIWFRIKSTRVVL